ncbi:hypothetical protein J3998_12850, partial [Thiomicrorhabdus sp. 6S2-11]
SALNHSKGYAYQTLPRIYLFKLLAEVNGDLFCVSLGVCLLFIVVVDKSLFGFYKYFYLVFGLVGLNYAVNNLLKLC